MKTRPFFKLCAVLLSTAMLFAFTGCLDKESNTDPNIGGDPDVDYSSLTYSTTQTVQINMNYDVIAGHAADFDLYAENPLKADAASGKLVLRSDVTPVGAGIAVSGKYSSTKTIPGYVKELYAYSNRLFTPILLYAKIQGGYANFENFDAEAMLPVSADTKTLADGKIDHQLGTWTTAGKPNYGEICDTLWVDGVSNRIATAFPEGKRISDADAERFYRDAILRLTEDAEVWVAVIHSDCGYNSSLSYFYAEPAGENYANLATIDKSAVREVLAFPRAKVSDGAPLEYNRYVQLKYWDESKGGWQDTFPKYTTIGFMLRSDNFRATGQNAGQLRDPKYKFYSYSAWNPEANADSARHTTYFNAGVTGAPFYCFGFEDMPNQRMQPLTGGNAERGDGDLNDMIFHVHLNPITAIDPPPAIPDYAQIEKIERVRGTLAYEDKWPEHFDYDFNDVVVEYKSSTTYAWGRIYKLHLDEIIGEDYAPVVVTNITDTFTLKHTSASFNNKFEYKIDMPYDWFSNITVDGSPYTKKADGDGFIVTVSEGLITDIGDGRPVADGGQGICTPKDVIVKMDFKYSSEIVEGGDYDGKIVLAGLTEEEFKEAGYKTSPYDPYIWYNKGREIHLPDYEPTQFGINNGVTGYYLQAQDATDPSNGKYYISKDVPFPFAFHLSGYIEYTIPAEGQDIRDKYSQYTDWVESNQTTYSNWYMFPNP